MPPGGATTRQSPRCHTTWIRVTAMTVVPLLAGPFGDDVDGRGRGRVGGQPVGGFDGIAAPGRLARCDVGGGAQRGVVAVVGGQQGRGRPGR